MQRQKQNQTTLKRIKLKLKRNIVEDLKPRIEKAKDMVL